jgi:hypothetical protein
VFGNTYLAHTLSFAPLFATRRRHRFWRGIEATFLELDPFSLGERASLTSE